MLRGVVASICIVTLSSSGCLDTWGDDDAEYSERFERALLHLEDAMRPGGDANGMTLRMVALGETVMSADVDLGRNGVARSVAEIYGTTIEVYCDDSRVLVRTGGTFGPAAAGVTCNDEIARSVGDDGRFAPDVKRFKGKSDGSFVATLSVPTAAYGVQEADVRVDRMDRIRSFSFDMQGTALSLDVHYGKRLDLHMPGDGPDPGTTSRPPQQDDEPAHRLIVVDVVGTRHGTSGPVRWLNVTVRPAQGGEAVDVGQLVLTVTTATNDVQLRYTSARDEGAGAFGMVAIRDADGSAAADTPVLTAGDLARLEIDLMAQPGDMSLKNRETVSLRFEGVGPTVATGFTTPPVYGDDTVIVFGGGSGSSNEVAQAPLLLKGIVGTRQGTTGDVHWLNITVAVAPGGSTHDLYETVLRIQDGWQERHLAYAPGDAGPDAFGAVVVRDEDGSFSASRPLLGPGDLVRLTIDLKAQGSMSLGTREAFSLRIIPMTGTMVQADFTSPASYGTDTIIVLR